MASRLGQDQFGGRVYGLVAICLVVGDLTGPARDISGWTACDHERRVTPKA